MAQSNHLKIKSMATLGTKFHPATSKGKDLRPRNLLRREGERPAQQLSTGLGMFVLMLPCSWQSRGALPNPAHPWASLLGRSVGTGSGSLVIEQDSIPTVEVRTVLSNS